jgi:hypothetical protein
MRSSIHLLIGIAFGISFNGDCMSEPSERMSIDKQIRLSPEHRVMPYHIMRVSNGDLIIFGSDNQVDYKAWAARVSLSGEVRWEFLQGGTNGWDDQTEKGQRYDTAIELPDHSTLLCGIKVVNYQRSVLLDRISVDGKLVGESVIRPDWDKGTLTGINCVRWNDGIALIGGVSASPSGTGWFAKLDENLNLKWQKFGNEYIATDGDVMSAPDGGVFYLNPSQLDAKGRRAPAVFEMSATGDTSARHVFDADNDPSMVYSVVPRSDLYLALATNTLETDIVHLDDKLHGPTQVIKLRNFGNKKAILLPDGSIAIFGSQYRNGATAAVARVYSSGDSKVFIVEPPHQSGWYYDAAFLGNNHQFVATRSIDDGRAALDWVSFK